MSKTYVNVRCNDWRTETSFIVFDDDDPPELVVIKVAESLALTALRLHGFEAALVDHSLLPTYTRRPSRQVQVFPLCIFSSTPTTGE